MKRFTIQQKIEETLKDFKVLSVRYRQVKDNKEMLDLFLSRNRNPIFDLSNNKMFRTGLVSDGVKNMGTKGVKGKVDDHFIQRKMAMKYIFDYIVGHPEIGYDEFESLLIKYTSTVKLTKDEHARVTKLAKGTDKFNFDLYNECGIVVEGLSDIIPNMLTDDDNEFYYSWLPSSDILTSRDKTAPTDNEYVIKEEWNKSDFDLFYEKYPYYVGQQTFPNNGMGREWFEKIADNFGGKFPVFMVKK